MQSLQTEIEVTLDVLSEATAPVLEKDVLSGVLNRIEAGEISQYRPTNHKIFPIVAAVVLVLAGMNLASLWNSSAKETVSEAQSTSWLNQEYKLDAGSYLEWEEQL